MPTESIPSIPSNHISSHLRPVQSESIRLHRVLSQPIQPKNKFLIILTYHPLRLNVYSPILPPLYPRNALDRHPNSIQSHPPILFHLILSQPKPLYSPIHPIPFHPIPLNLISTHLRSSYSPPPSISPYPIISYPIRNEICQLPTSHTRYNYRAYAPHTFICRYGWLSL